MPSHLAQRYLHAPIFYWGRVVQATAAGVVVAANGGKNAGFGQSEANHLLHDAQNQLGAGGDGEFFEQAVQMCVNGVFRNAESLGDPGFRQIIKDALNHLQLTLRQTQLGTDLKPSMVAEECGSAQLAA